MQFQELNPQEMKPAAPQGMAGAFEPLQFAMTPIALPAASYRVYLANGQYTEVEAASAYEAMQKTGIRHPYKIERVSLNRLRILSPEVLSGKAEEKPVPAASVSATAVPEGMAPETASGNDEAAMAGRELSDAEMAALLDSNKPE